MANGAFGGLGAVFATEVGLSTTGVAIFMSAALVGGALFQVPFGRLSDRIDRRRVLIVACALAVIGGSLLALAADAAGGAPGFWAIFRSPWVMMTAVVLFGGCIYSMYSLCVAHTNDHVEREDFVEATSGLLLTWGIGASIGPVAAAVVIDLVGLRGLFLFTAAVHVLFMAFTWYRITRRTSLPPEARTDFVLAGPSRTSPIVSTLDPRAPDQPEEPPTDAQEQAAA
jgi:MFS family permease